MEMSPLEFDVLDEVYFVVSFEDILSTINENAEQVKESIKKLLQEEYVWQMHFNAKLNDFEISGTPDLAHVEHYHYLATKKGLLARHTG